jgi:hypothetical protein
MNKQIYQCYASPTMEEHFAKDLRNRWDLTKYKNPNEPTLMFGWYNNHKDVTFLNNHKGPIVMLWGGNDMNYDRAKFLANRPNTYQIGYGWQSRLLNQWQVPHKNVIIPIKDYSKFKLNPLGDKIYVYQGWKFSRSQYFKWEEFIQPLINEWGENNFVFGMGHDIDYVYENYYKKCFVYIKPNERGGSTGMWELGHMGRKTIAQNQGNAPNVLEYKNLKDIASLVNHEAKKIGTIQNSISEQVKDFMMNTNEWLNLDWWEN